MEELRQEKNRLKREIKQVTLISRKLVDDNGTKTENLVTLIVALSIQNIYIYMYIYIYMI